MAEPSSASGEKDPYMQAYITARMKNQVEEMKLQKILSTMEVSQRVKKIMINLELFEDRKVAHKLQKEVMGIANRQRQAMNRYLRQKGSRQRLTSNWASAMVRSEPAHTLPNSSEAGDLAHSYPHQPHPPRHPQTVPSSSRRAVYPVTRGKDYGEEGEFPALGSKATSAQRSKSGGKNGTTMPVIQVTDCSAQAAPAHPSPAAVRADSDPVPVKGRAAWVEANAAGASAAVPTTKTATIITPPPITHRVHNSHPHHSHQSTPHQHHHHSAPNSVHFPPVWARSGVGRMRSTMKARTSDDASKKRLTSAGMWQGDPRAISSVRRDRRNIDDMLSTVKSGEETRRLIRDAVPTCSRNCGKPNIMSLLERTYFNLPDLLPEIEKERQRMAEEEAAEREIPEDQDSFLNTSLDKKRSHGRFDLEDDQDTGSKNLPIYHIDYSSLREIGGTRRNSVLA